MENGERDHLLSDASLRSFPESTGSTAEDELRRKLKYFFMNPCQKFVAKRRLPWKLLLQLVKVVLVTVQLILFGTSRASHIDFLETSEIAFKHLYLKDWTPSYETMPYPPAMGTYAVYTIADFYDAVNFVLDRYNKTEKIAIGTYHFTLPNNTMEPIQLCKNFYEQGVIWAFNESYIFDSTQDTECFPMYPVEINGTMKYDTHEYLEKVNKSINFDRLIKLWLKFSLKTIHLKSLSKVNLPDCYQFDIVIMFDNEDHNGQMAVTLDSDEDVLTCNGVVTYSNDDQLGNVMITLFDTLVMIISLLSIILCSRSILRAVDLMKETVKFFEVYHTMPPLSFNEKLDFINMWYILIIVNDFLTIIGSILKILIDNKVTESYEACGVLLGTGNLLVWFGVLRYLGFFKKYNVLLLTMKRSAPNVLRFLVCAGVFYFGFAICGWVILGPYHIKFRKLSTASECLFSLINGDDIFTTFATMSEANAVMWWFSRLYLYFFTGLFIYVILSVFISVIMDTYETIKKNYQDGTPKSRLHAFADECRDDPDTLFSSETNNCCVTSCLNSFTPQRRELSVHCDDADFHSDDVI